MSSAMQSDVEIVQSIAAVPGMLAAIAHATGLRWVAIARVTDLALTLCAVHDTLALGFPPGAELDVTQTLCDRVRRGQASLFVDEIAADRAASNHPSPHMHGFQSYFSIPIHRKGGEFFGTLCGLDPAPRRLSDAVTRESLEVCAQLLSSQIDDLDHLNATQEALVAEQDSNLMREGLIGIVTDDLRTSLSTISACAGLAGMIAHDERTLKAMSRIHLSVAHIAGLLGTVMDYTRSRGDGAAAADLAPQSDMRQVLRHVIDELRLAHPGRDIMVELALTEAVSCDALRIAQLASNLLVNALLHGDRTTPVRLVAHTANHAFTLKVINRGAPIGVDVIPTLFDPFSNRGQQGKDGGLGLGLYIAAEIAKAHHGTLAVASADGRTVFTFSMPLSAAA